MRKLLAVLLAALIPLVAVASTARADATGTLTIASGTIAEGQTVELTYATNAPHPTNWIGLYREPGNGPVDQTYVGPSIVWEYVTAASGTVEFDSADLQPGAYSAYFLAQDGYRWLADPVDFSVVGDEPLHFVNERAPLRNAWQWTDYDATVSGLVVGDRTGLTFRKVSGAPWLTVAADGTVGGIPLGSTGGTTSEAVVEATNTAGESARATVEVEVRRPSTALAPTVKAMSWNLWHGGTQVRDYREKQLRFVLDQDVDVIGFQESEGTSATDLGEALGWDHFQAGPDLGFISRYPIVDRSDLPARSGLAGASVTVQLDPRRDTEVTVWNVHLGYTPYGPYDACFGHDSIEELMAKEASSGRTGQIQDVVAAMGADLAASADRQVLLTGDFNAASHLDWSATTKRCGYRQGVPWPASVVPTQAGLVDTFRAAHPSAKRVPGNTWSPIYTTFTGGYGHDDHTGEPEPKDRIDFVYAKGGWKVTDSQLVVAGTPAPIPDHTGNEWTSDHAAVVTTFRVG